MEEIFNILDYYSKNKMILDKQAINAIIKLLFLENDVDNYYEAKIYNFYAPLKDKKILACFDYEKLYIYISRLKKFVINDKDKNKTRFLIEDEFNEYESYLFKNIYIFRIIVHEIEHILHYEGKIDNYSDIELSLMRAEKNFLIDIGRFIEEYKGDKLYKTLRGYELKKLYSDNYDLSFIERITEINAIEKTIDMLEKYSNNDKLIKITDLFLLNAKMKTYINSRDIPTERFFSNIGRLDEYFKIDQDNLGYEERLRYGFKLEPKEFINNKNILSLTKKRK